jgi:hypothetical protein
MTEKLFDEMLSLILRQLEEQNETIKKLEQKINDLENKSTPDSITDLNLIDLSRLPAYRHAAIFKEIKRPSNLNELYMVLLQNQHTLYELQSHVDNLSRKN